MHPDTAKLMKRDCRRFLRTVMITSFFHRLITVTAPTIAAWMIGDMANHLLNLDETAISEGMPAFLCAVFFQVVVAALCNLKLNLLLTKQGFAYDGFLMEKFIRLPLSVLQTTDVGSVMERLETDSAAFCWNQMILHAYPGAILLCFAVYGYAILQNGCHLLFALTIVMLAALPVVRAAQISRPQTQLKKQLSANQDSRKQMEQELFEARDFSKSYSLDNFFIHRLREEFDLFLTKTGSALYRMEAKTEQLDFLCSYGVPLCAMLMGAILISFQQLTIGALLTGYLMIPTLRQCFSYVKDWVTESQEEKKYMERLAFFYRAGSESASTAPVLHSLDSDDITFSYPDSELPVLNAVDFHMTATENYRLTGANGSGKTTLMSVLAGLYEPQTGSVCHGADVMQRRKSVAFQEQNGTVFSGTIWDNLFLPDNKRQKAAKLLKEMGMEKPLDYEIASGAANLSPGEKKKLLLVRALLRDAPFLLLDEPLNHLDEQGRQVLGDILEKRKGGLLLISHQDFISKEDSIKEYPFRTDS